MPAITVLSFLRPPYILYSFSDSVHADAMLMHARRQEESVHNVQFVPFSLEAGGVWGPAAKKFFKQCASQADNQDRDVDLYHWSSAKFESTWRDTISVLVARGRAQVGVHSAKSDWSRRILDFAYMDYDDQAAHHE